MLEILSPAGSPEAVIAAVQSGADAVYMGFGEFNARSGAKNFSEEEFADAVKYCHVRGVRVYVTLNTLVRDRELGAAVEFAKLSARYGADGIIIQDIGYAKILREVLPDMPLHASTQMSVHNLAGVLAAAQMGITRVVLARELSLAQIEFICKNSPIELEVFVHGALCFCHSGQCYMSGLIGSHSGNRGKCAQTCRMEFSLGGRMDHKPMSLKDNCLIKYVDQLEAMGVASAKIEGRAKRPEYVAIVTEIYANAVKNKKAPTALDMQRLEQAFSRQGFTDGYITGKLGSDMFGVRHEPERSMIDKLFSETRKKYINAEVRRAAVKFYAVIEAGKSSKFAIEDAEGRRIAIESEIPQSAKTRDIDGQYVTDQLYKTGGTPYVCVEINCKVDRGLFMSASKLNEVRRELISLLTAERRRPRDLKVGNFPALPLSSPANGRPRTIYQVTTAEQLTPELAETRPAYLYVPLELLQSSAPLVAPFVRVGATIVAVLPRIITDAEMMRVSEYLQVVKNMGVTEVLVGNIGHIAVCRQFGFAVRGDYGLNLFNSYGLDVAKSAGLLSATASFELRISQIRAMLKPVNVEMLVYGRLPAMVSDQCIIKKNNSQLADTRGSVFPVIHEFGGRNVVLNAHRLYLADKAEDYADIGLWGARLLFTTESGRECVSIAKNYMGSGDYLASNITRGLYYRGVK